MPGGRHSPDDLSGRLSDRLCGCSFQAAAETLAEIGGIDAMAARGHHEHGLAVEREYEGVGDRADLDAGRCGRRGMARR